MLVFQNIGRVLGDCIWSLQLLTVEHQAPPSMEQWAHPLEPPLGALLPTPVKALDTYSMVMLVGLVKLMGGVAEHQPVNVSSLFSYM